MSKKLLLIVFFSLLLPLMLCTKVNATTVGVYCPPTMELYGENKSVSITVTKSTGKTTNDYTKTFSSSNTGIVSIDSKGKMTAKNVGKATIKINVKYLGKTYKFNKDVTVSRRKLSDFGKVSITETTKNISTKWNESNPYLKTSNNTWCLNFYGYNGVSVKSNNSGYYNGAVALYTIQGIRGMSPNKSYLTASTNANSTYFVKDAGTNFKIIGYKWAPNYSSYQSFLQAIYNEILAGYPVAIHVYNSANQDIYVVGYAVNSTKIRQSGKLSANDILVIDTSVGQWRKLGDFREYKQNGKYVLGIHDSTNPNLTKKSFAKVAAECYNYFNTNKFTYRQGNKIPYPNGTKTVDCSAYVSWALYKYGYTKDLNGKTFTWQMTVSGIDSFCKAKGFTKITDLSKIKAGDILIWGPNTHCEIVKTDGNYKYTYNCGSTQAIQDSTRGGYGCVKTPSYAYRVP